MALYVTSSAFVVKAIVPHSRASSSPSVPEKIKPHRPSCSRKLFLFVLPAVRLARVPQTVASMSWSLLLLSTYRRQAMGMPLRSASPGIRGLKASRRTDSGTVGSFSVTWPNG
jgi:hypothetical protein